MILSNIETQDIKFVHEDTAAEDIARLLRESQAGVVPVVRSCRTVGTITDRDMVIRAIALGRDLSKCRAKHVMEARPVTIDWQSDDSTVIEAANLMRRHKIQRAIVTRDGLPAGVVSLRALGQLALAESYVVKETSSQSLTLQYPEEKLSVPGSSPFFLG
jgi:signal-transduction protein with cAMP-binding, CBS, and nucleotidyltransferase domain